VHLFSTRDSKQLTSLSEEVTSLDFVGSVALMFIIVGAIGDAIVWLNQETRNALDEKGAWLYFEPFDSPHIEAENEASNRPETVSSSL
jgi:hypothetical protein